MDPSLADARTGSSPRGRGTPPIPTLVLVGPRFIPARAGNTTAIASPRMDRTVHPRAGGEHRNHCSITARSDGSSPRGRGTRSDLPTLFGRPRFIPARAGNTWDPCAPRYTGPVHPRAGGEHESSDGNLLNVNGSSPRGRGTPAIADKAERLCRFIPARAGNTIEFLRRLPSPSVHPRAGGEHAMLRHRNGAEIGSSPRGRGTPFLHECPSHVFRFIPAREGNTAIGSFSSRASAVHPRAGGEHLGSFGVR